MLNIHRSSLLSITYPTLILFLLAGFSHISAVNVMAQPETDVLGVLLFSGGSNDSQTTLSSGKALLNPAVFRMEYYWSKAQPHETDALTFDGNQDAAIDRAVALGVDVYITMYTGLGWMNNCPSGTRALCGTKSRPPNPEYLEKYALFLSEFSRRYADKVAIIGIENEQNAVNFYDGTKEQYMNQMATAYAAIKSQAPSMIVTDGGVVGDVWGACIAKAWRDDPAYGKSESDILAMAKIFFDRKIRRGNYPPLQTIADVNALISAVENETPARESNCTELYYYLQRYNGISDRVSFHLYEDYVALPYILEWIPAYLARYGYELPVMTNEIGYWNDPGYGNLTTSTLYAMDVFKSIIFLKAHAVSPIIWYSFDTYNNDALQAVSLLDDVAPGPQPRLAALSYKFIADTFTALQTVTIKADGPQWYDYVFSGDETYRFEAIWSESGPVTRQLVNPNGTGEAFVYDYTGQLVSRYQSTSNVTLVVDAPVLIKWVLPQPGNTPIVKPGDANGDGRVDGIDYVVWYNHYNQSVSGASSGDFNNSGRVDGVDYVIWLNNYGR